MNRIGTVRRPGAGTAAFFLALTISSPVAAQEPTPAPTPMPAPQPTPMWAPGQAGPTPRRGWFGISLSCEDCFIQRGPGRVAYVISPAVNSVESGSPAWQAGMRSGDTIVSIDGFSMTQPEGFERFASALPGQSVRVGLRKGGELREVVVIPSTNSSTNTVAEYYNSRLRSALRNGPRAYRSLFRKPFGWLGFGVQFTVGGDRRRDLREPPVVLTVDVDGPAHRAGLRRGDTLTAMDGVDLLNNTSERVFSEVEPGQRVTLTVKRGGPERRVVLTAVARPDATREELSAFDEYKRMRDSSEAQYRELLSASVARAQTEITDLQRMLRELEASRAPVDSSRRRIATIDSLLRALRNLERQRISQGGNFGYSFSSPIVYAVPPTAAIPLPLAGRVFPLRYSKDMRGMVRVDARSPAQISVNEVGDSLIVVTTTTGVEVKVQLLPARRR